MFFRRISIGRLFRSRGPAARKLLSSICNCVRGTVHVWTNVWWPEVPTFHISASLAANEVVWALEWCGHVDQLQWRAVLPRSVPTAAVGSDRQRCHTAVRYSSLVGMTRTTELKFSWHRLTTNAQSFVADAAGIRPNDRLQWRGQTSLSHSQWPLPGHVLSQQPWRMLTGLERLECWAWAVSTWSPATRLAFWLGLVAVGLSSTRLQRRQKIGLPPPQHRQLACWCRFDCRQHTDAEWSRDLPPLD